MAVDSARIEQDPSPVEEFAERIKNLLGAGAGVLPRGAGQDTPLVVVVAVMCYLATLALGGLLLVNQSAEQWTTGLEGSITVTVHASSSQPASDEASPSAKALTLLAATPGIVQVDMVPVDEARQLLEPWLGEANLLDDLPVPILIDVRVDPDAPPDLKALGNRLAEIDPAITVEDHRHWNDRILAFSDMLRAVAAAILVLIGATTIAIAIFATRAGLAARQEIVDVLHLMGAQDMFIAREFQNVFVALGIKAGAIGLAGALATFWAVSAVSGAVAGNAAAGITPALELSVGHLITLIIVPIITLLAIATTTRITVMRSLARAYL